MTKEFYKYLIVGGLAFLADFSIYTTLVNFGNVNYLIANLIAYSIGFVIVFYLNTSWVFEFRKYKGKKRELIIFILIALTALGISELVLLLSVGYLDVEQHLGKIFSQVVVVVFNFILRKKILFS